MGVRSGLIRAVLNSSASWLPLDGWRVADYGSSRCEIQARGAKRVGGLPGEEQTHQLLVADRPKQRALASVEDRGLRLVRREPTAQVGYVQHKSPNLGCEPQEIELHGVPLLALVATVDGSSCA